VTTQQCKPKARLLTSAECLRMLQEKEDKKGKRTKAKRTRIEKSSERARSTKEERRKGMKGARESRKGFAKINKCSIPAVKQNPKNNKRLKIINSMQVDKETQDEDVNVCCMCFGCYENDVQEGYRAEWMKYPCGRWLHVECVEDSFMDSSGQSRYSPYCIDGL